MSMPNTQPPFKQPAQNVPNYLVQAILVTIFCCLPFGIVSIVFAAQVNGKLAVGDINGAVQASNQAKTWSWVAFGCGLVVGIIYFGVMALGIMSAAAGAGAGMR